MLTGAPPALAIWLREWRRNPSERRRIREIARRVARGLRALRRKEGDLFARGGVR